jgi:hypothetical protein
MKRVILALGLVCLVAAVAFAQGKTNFSGTWTPEQAAAAAGGGGGGRGPGGPITITQTEKELTVERTMGENVIKTVYKLDGTESVNESARGGKSTSVCKWDGAKLLITTKSEGPNGPMEVTQTWFLKDASTMVQERPGQGGNVRTTVYTKGK